MKLPLKVQLFIEEYLVDGNATQAAVRAGYSKRSARNIGSRMMTNDDIRKIIETRKKELADACDVTKQELIRNAREVIIRCRMSGRKYRPREVLLANRQLGDLTGLIATHTELTGANAGPVELVVRNIGRAPSRPA